jgi:hypothetical protein
MNKIDELRQTHGSFPGGLFNVLQDFDERLKALETHKPMLDSLKPEYDEHIARQQAEAEQPPAEQPPAEQPPAEQPGTAPEGTQAE